MILIAGSLPVNMILGLIVGIISAFLAVMFSILNKKIIHQADPIVITFLEMSGGWLLLTAFLPVFFYLNIDADFLPKGYDWLYLLILAVVCTNLGYWIALKTLKHISAFASNLTINLEPIYGIIFAWLILKEDKQLTPFFYIGATMILAAVFSYPFFRKRFKKIPPSVV
jgi:drug/metabolite transporter (DMT)-like permease